MSFFPSIDDIDVMIKQTLTQVLKESFRIQSNWIAEEHSIKIDIIFDTQESPNWYKEPPCIQLKILTSLLYTLDQDRIHHMNLFAHLPSVLPYPMQNT